ncbi:hypothetical protein [Ruminococcus sp. 5_1_39BFAA]|uniref:hypothetical protein n=1 Tax=Ruminococcus sp. 5_1_39BFAA TaxID=457412 RepID=UPI00356B08A2
MKELEKIYEAWSTNEPDTQEIISLWEKVEKKLSALPEEVHKTDFSDCVIDYASALEKRAFQSGYTKGALLMCDIFIRVGL